jgi:mannose-6-phosphate isomerase-like protein (cupin superfamily)
MTKNKGIERKIRVEKEKVVKVSEIKGFAPSGSGGNYISRLLIESEGVGSARLMLVHATLKPGKAPGDAAAHPTPYDEAYYILRGQGLMEFGDGEESYEVGPDTAIFIPADTLHKITNTGTEDLEFLTIWPITPAEEGVNGVFDERKRLWGKSFRKVDG